MDLEPLTVRHIRALFFQQQQQQQVVLTLADYCEYDDDDDIRFLNYDVSLKQMEIVVSDSVTAYLLYKDEDGDEMGFLIYFDTGEHHRHEKIGRLANNPGNSQCWFKQGKYPANEDAYPFDDEHMRNMNDAWTVDDWRQMAFWMGLESQVHDVNPKA